MPLELLAYTLHRRSSKTWKRNRPTRELIEAILVRWLFLTFCNMSSCVFEFVLRVLATNEFVFISDIWYRLLLDST